MTEDPARLATVQSALSRLRPGMTIGLGSGRAVFALTQRLGEEFGMKAGFRAVVASPETAGLAQNSGVDVIDLSADVVLDIAFDGADELDSKLRMIKGGGAALMREKLVLAAANHVVILAEASKLVDYLGTHRSLPVEIVPFAWAQTQTRVGKVIDDPALRVDSRGTPVVTANGNFLLDGRLREGADLADVALTLDTTLGVVAHGLFLSEADEIVLGKPDGSIVTLSR